MHGNIMYRARRMTGSAAPSRAPGRGSRVQGCGYTGRGKRRKIREAGRRTYRRDNGRRSGGRWGRPGAETRGQGEQRANGNCFGGTIVGDGQSPTGRGRGSKGRPGRVGGCASRKAAGSGRRGGHEGDDGIGVCVGDSLGRARGRGAGVCPRLSAVDSADGFAGSCDDGLD